MKIGEAPSVLALQELMSDRQTAGTALRAQSATDDAPGRETAAPPASLAVSSGHASGNVMSGNFYNRDFEQSKYVEFRLDTFRQEKQAANSMSAMLGNLMAQASVMGFNNVRDSSGRLTSEYVIALRLKRRAEEHMERERQKEVNANAERHLEKTREHIAEQAEEALAPKDENGIPIEMLPEAGTGAPAPEGPAEIPAETPAVQEQAAAPAETGAPAALPTVHPVGPPINLLV